MEDLRRRDRLRRPLLVVPFPDRDLSWRPLMLITRLVDSIGGWMQDCVPRRVVGYRLSPRFFVHVMGLGERQSQAATERQHVWGLPFSSSLR